MYLSLSLSLVRKRMLIHDVNMVDLNAASTYIQRRENIRRCVTKLHSHVGGTLCIAIRENIAERRICA